MDARLFDPRPAPPPLAALAASPWRRQWATARMLWRARKNLLHLFHPEVQEVGHAALDFAGERLITLADAGMGRQVLGDRYERYIKAPLYHSILGEVLGPTASLLIEGDASRQRRRLLAPAFNARAMARAEAVVERHVTALLDRWAAGDGTVDLTRDIPRFALALAMDAFFSSEPGAAAARLAATIEALLHEAGTPAFADLANLPAWVPRKGRRRLRALVAELDAALFPLIDARRERPGPGDLLDVLIGARDAETGAALSRQDVRDEVMTLFLAGHETTALSLIWGLDRLAREPQAAQALRDAARAIPPTVAASRALPLCSQTYDEILRLYPPAFALARQAVARDQVGPYAIQPGDRLQIAVFMIHRSPRHWTAPGAFDPSRFAGKAPEAFMPFGAGPRLCIGLAFARLEAQHLMARALVRFDLKPVGPPPQPLGRITLRTDGPVRLRVGLAPG